MSFQLTERAVQTLSYLSESFRNVNMEIYNSYPCTLCMHNNDVIYWKTETFLLFGKIFGFGSRQQTKFTVTSPP